MIEVDLELEVTPEELFDVIVPSVLYDIKESTGKNVKVNQLHDNYTYKKKLKSNLGKEAGVKVTIAKFEYPVVYEARFESASGSNMMRYEVERLENGNSGLAYVEDFEGAGKMASMNGWLVGLIYNHKAKKDIKKRLRAMERSIIENRAMDDDTFLEADENNENAE